MRKSKVLLLVDGLFNPQISECTYADVRQAIQGLGRIKLDILIQSHGGSPNAAFKIGRLLQKQLGRFSVLVPEFAKSAATMICLGASETVMAGDAELGPIDTQLADSREADGWVSALQEFKGLEAVSSFCQGFLDTTAQLVHDIAGHSINDSFQVASRFVPPLLRPLFQQVDPRSLGRFKRGLEITEFYGERLLRASGVAAEPARRIVHALVYDYPSHDFVIQQDEAARMGLAAVAASAQLEVAMSDVLDVVPEQGFTGFIPKAAPGKTPSPPAKKNGARSTNGKAASAVLS